ncbi:5-formyltetrahydrofolate cyclo-ligase [Sedimenticola hydrogenitrophicus]|uniref:5-formyltetrahydrofolate cyclo-ligase n=1 Tax=Sedimenticola hydrogenitrophicus TaxID=2967975 RepID=UPI0023AF848C|nr:5-formyltetrahydrofolate cyclo-ligase [Sedimenticola hydrogenitrophicus]
MKKSLRQEIFRQRKALDAQSYQEHSRAVMQRLLDNGFLDEVKSVHLYYAIYNEVNTLELIEELWRRDIQVVMPRTDLKNHKLDNYQVTSFDQFEERTAFNLLEPKQSLPRHEEDCDLILVPGLVFDHNLNRIGYGGGFYDRFLARSNGRKVAIAYDFQVRESIPSEPHDIRMDQIVTDTRIYA